MKLAWKIIRQSGKSKVFSYDSVHPSSLIKLLGFPMQKLNHSVHTRSHKMFTLTPIVGSFKSMKIVVVACVSVLKHDIIFFLF